MSFDLEYTLEATIPVDGVDHFLCNIDCVLGIRCWSEGREVSGERPMEWELEDLQIETWRNGEKKLIEINFSNCRQAPYDWIEQQVKHRLATDRSVIARIDDRVWEYLQAIRETA